MTSILQREREKNQTNGRRQCSFKFEWLSVSPLLRVSVSASPDEIKETKEEYRHCKGYRRNNNAIVVLNPAYVPRTLLSFTVADFTYVCNIYI